MRPEGTAPIVRSYVEHSLDKVSPESKLYYIGPMFRSERPQKGRQRQFHQIGVEVIGTSSPYADIEVIVQLDGLLKRFGLKDFTIKLNSLGCRSDKENFKTTLKKYLKDKEARLCGDCKKRMKKNPLRVLDCKSESCIQVLRGAPSVVDSLCDSCKKHFDKVRSVLKSLKLTFKETPNLVRGLDYYTGTVFEITHPALGGQDAIGAGGRYDNLVKDLGGPEVGAIGYALGIERIILALGTSKEDFACCSKTTLYIATLGDEAKVEGIKIAGEIRKLNIRVLTDTRDVSLKAQMRTADKNKAKFVLILGEDELKERKIVLRDMDTKSQDSLEIDSIQEEIKKRWSNYVKDAHSRRTKQKRCR